MRRNIGLFYRGASRTEQITGTMPKKPEEWVDQVPPREKTKGTCKLFLGYAPGVGKTYAMLSEGICCRRVLRRQGGQIETYPAKPLPARAISMRYRPRPGTGYDPLASRGSNLGPKNNEEPSVT